MRPSLPSKYKNLSIQKRWERARDMGPAYLATFNAWRECRLGATRPYKVADALWCYDHVTPQGAPLTLKFATHAAACRTSAYVILAQMAETVPLDKMELYVLPRSFREAWNKLAQERGIIPRRVPGGKWTESRKARMAAGSRRRWKRQKEEEAARSQAAILASLPPVSSLTERAAAKLLARLRRRYPHAPAATLDMLARLDSGAW